LRKKGDQRWKAFKEIIELAKRMEVDVLVIAGDMFDKGVDGESLRSDVRELFKNIRFKTLILPGNHDSSVFDSGRFWGNNVEVIDNYLKPYSIGDVDFWGLPFEDIKEDEVLSKIFEMNERMRNDRTNILIYHGELGDYSWMKGFGDEDDENKRYMPVKKEFFKDTKIDYVLAGHFHTKFDSIKLPNGGWFIYPGTPVSITKKEVGIRSVNILDVGNSPQQVSLPTFHYKRIVITLDPFKHQNPIQIIDGEVKKYTSLDSPNFQLILCVGGYIDSRKGVSELDIMNYLTQIYREHRELFLEPPINDVRDISVIINHPLYQDFNSKLQKRVSDEEQRQRILEYVIKAMMEVFY